MKADNKRFKNFKDGLSSVSAIISVYLLLAIIGIGCPIKFLTGVSCPGCGMTRAFKALAHMKVSDAFNFHPLWPIPIMWTVVWGIKNYYTKRDDLQKDILVSRWKMIYRLFCYVSILAFIVTYFVRLFIFKSSVVEFNPADGFIIHRLKIIFEYLR